jgi:hypothetical protein
LVYAIVERPAPPNYRAAATTDCLRAAGYTVSAGHEYGAPTLVIKGHSIPWYGDVVYFASSEAAARRIVQAHSDSIPDLRTRNVVWDNEGGPFPDFLSACLQSQ